MIRFLRTLPAALLALLLLLPIVACSPSGQDDAPLDINPDKPRIVVISPALAAILIDLDLEDNIVGRHGWDQVLAPAVPVCGDQSGLDYEALLRARPTHVFTQWGSRDLPAKLANLATDKGWIVRDFGLLTLADIDSTASALEALFPLAIPNERVEQFHRLLAAPLPEPIWEGRVLLLMGTSPIAAIGPGSAHHELLMRAGGVPAIEEGSPYMPLHAEDVLRLAPDAIILIQPGGESSPDATDMKRSLGVVADLAIPAVEHGRIRLISDPLALLPSTRLVEVAERIELMLIMWDER